MEFVDLLETYLSTESISFDNYLDRLYTFATWPAVSQSKTALAQCGFYYTNICDQVVCHSCGVNIFGWQEGDNVWEQHVLLSQNRKCKFLQAVLGEKAIDFIIMKFARQTTSSFELEDNSILSIQKELIVGDFPSANGPPMESNNRVNPIESLKIPPQLLEISEECQTRLINKLTEMIRAGTVSYDIQSLVKEYNSYIRQNLDNLIEEYNALSQDENGITSPAPITSAANVTREDVSVDQSDMLLTATTSASTSTRSMDVVEREIPANEHRGTISQPGSERVGNSIIDEVFHEIDIDINLQDQDHNHFIKKNNY